MDQLKIFKAFDLKEFNRLKLIINNENLYCFEKSGAIGIKYNYNDFKLKDVMGMVSFTSMQQLILTPTNLIEIYKKLLNEKYRVTITYTNELPEEITMEFEETLKSSLSEDYNEIIMDKLNNIEEEFQSYIKSLHFFYEKERITINSNGIIFGNDNAYKFADELIFSAKQLNI